MWTVIAFFVSPSGRFRRLDYWGHAFAMVGLWIVVGMLCSSRVEALSESMHKMAVNGDKSLPPEFWSILYPFFAMMIVQMISSITAGIKRFHDFGSSGWAMFWMIVPLANIWFAIKLMFFRGEEGDNAYGPSPYKTTTL